MDVTLSDPQVAGLGLLDDLTDDQKSTLAKEIASWPASLDFEGLAKRLAERLAVDPSGLEAAFNTVAAIPGHARRSAQPLPAAMYDVLKAYAETTEEEEKATNAEPHPELVKLIEALLRHGSPFALAAKAVNLTWEHSELFNDVRIFSDLRPLFDTDFGSSDSKIVGHALTHTLRLAYLSRERENFEARFILMTHKDLLKLQEAVTRALDKHRSILGEKFPGQLIQ